MKITPVLICTVLILAISCGEKKETKNEITLKYPVTKKTEHTDEYFGVKVSDPYQWLEDDRSKEAEAWVKEQNIVTNDYLNAIPYKEKIKKRFADLFNYPKLSAPFKAGEYYFFSKNNGLQNQSVIYYQKGLEGKPEVFIDPNTYSKDGTVAIGLAGFSNDFKYVAYTQSAAGSDWETIKVREIATNKDVPDQIEWAKFTGAAWYKDGFYYSRYPKPEKGKEFTSDNKNHSIYYHKLGTTQDKDVLFYDGKKNPNYYHSCYLTEDELYLIMTASSGTDGFECYYMDLKNNGPLTPLFTGFEHKSSVIEHTNGNFLVITDIDAPNYRLVSINIKDPVKERWVEIIPEKQELLSGVSTGGGKLFASYLKNATSAIYQMDYDGKNITEIKLPGLGSAGGFGGYKNDKELFYTYSSFNYPPSIFHYNIKTGESKIFNKSALKFNADDYETEQVWYESKDKTKVPMFIVHKKGMKMDGTHPTLLYAYGGFNVSLTPWFSVSNIILLENDGIYALANLRGGGEFGEAWHRGGMKLNKQNVFDDFISAGEFLIKNNYTCKEKLAIEGGSNGGLLIGACITQKPEMCQVAFPDVGVMDMLKFHKFTVGKGWIPEFGCADSSKVEFDYLYGYSPLHNVKEVCYPATMVATGDHDDRVVPAHSFKFAATLQEKQKCSNPVLITIATDAGHGAGKPISKIVEEVANKWAFMFYNVGIKDVYSDIK